MRHLQFWCSFTATQYAILALWRRRKRMRSANSRRCAAGGTEARRGRARTAPDRERAACPKLRLAGSRARPLFHRCPATLPSSRSCRPPFHCSMRRSSPPARSNATAPRRRSSTGWRSSKSDSSSIVSRASRPRSGWLFGAREAESIKGLYIFGEVGRGKTMLMDLFFAASPVVRKRRVHFHEFMTDVHERIYALRQRAKLAKSAARIRSPSPPPRSRKRRGCFASTSSTSPTSPTP